MRATADRTFALPVLVFSLALPGWPGAVAETACVTARAMCVTKGDARVIAEPDAVAQDS